jgi:hypothetical protein
MCVPRKLYHAVFTFANKPPTTIIKLRRSSTVECNAASVQRKIGFITWTPARHDGAEDGQLARIAVALAKLSQL